jgi:threonylcarbamoyladenosine tRNA methylthiotransferase MtaB
MPQLGRAVVKDRARQLREKGAAMLSQRLAALVGSNQELLVEDACTARTPCFASARLDAPSSPGTLLRACIEASDGRNLHARVLNAAQSW